MKSGGAMALAAALLFVAGCTINVGDGPRGSIGEMKHETRSVARSAAAKAEQVSAEIHMGAGELSIEGGAQELLDAEFDYNVAEWKPEVRYEGEGGFRGKLVVRQGAGSVAMGDVKNRWRLKLAEDIPLDLAVHCGAGENRLDLSRLDLRQADVHLGAGRVEMDLRGQPKHDLTVDINGGVGEAKIRVSADANVIATARGGIGEIDVSGMEKRNGEYVTGKKMAKATLRLNVKGGIGRIEIRAE
jgi:hypothetical protein